MSYADVAASGPKQSPEEVGAPMKKLSEQANNMSGRDSVEALQHSRDETVTHLRDTLRERLGSILTAGSRAPPMQEVEHDTSSSQSLIDVDSPHISSVPSDYEDQSVKTDTQAERLEHEADDAKIKAEQKAQQAKEKAQKAKEEAKQKAGLAGKRIRENSDNPVVLGNAVLVGLGGLGLGWFAYRKYTAGEFNWRLGGILAGAVGIFAAADIYVSNILFKKYPPKK